MTTPHPAAREAAEKCADLVWKSFDGSQHRYKLDDVTALISTAIDQAHGELMRQLEEAKRQAQDHFDAYQSMYKEMKFQEECSELRLKSWRDSQTQLALLTAERDALRERKS